MSDMLKVSSNPKITISAEMDFSQASKLSISALNCDKLEKRVHLMRLLLNAVRNDLNKTEAFIAEQNSPGLF